MDIFLLTPPPHTPGTWLGAGVPTGEVCGKGTRLSPSRLSGSLGTCMGRTLLLRVDARLVPQQIPGEGMGDAEYCYLPIAYLHPFLHKHLLSLRQALQEALGTRVKWDLACALQRLQSDGGSIEEKGKGIC